VTTGADPGAPPRVALIMIAVGDLSGSGGAERQFSGLHERLSELHPGRSTFITARSSLRKLQEAGHLLQPRDVVALPLGPHPARSRLAVIWMTVTLFWATLFRGFDIVHVCLPTPSYVPYAALLTRLPPAWRPRLVVNVIDCTLAHNLMKGRATDLYEQQVLDAHRMYFRWVRLDGLFTWYRAFLDVARRMGLLKPSVVVAPARYCFTDTRLFRPAAKEPLIVFAGRFSEQKRPLLFVDTVAKLIRAHPALVEGWRFEMYGGGTLEPQVRRRIADRGLGDVIRLARVPDMSPVFARSRLFVSTQALENFTSLAMLEAMAAGNAVIAEDVGQTREFARPGENGLLATHATAEAFAAAIAQYLQQPERHDAMAEASRRLANDVHTIDSFIDDISRFWTDVVRGRRA
jgi:glycosyltransferase involved in cell wall biosynthesis